MLPPPRASPLADLERALSSSLPDQASDATLRALQEGTPFLEVVRVAARVTASRYDPAAALPPHGLAALSVAASLPQWMDPGDIPFALLQAVVLAASERKLGSPQPPAPALSGEVTHLGRSAILAARSGADDAEPLFLGIVQEGWERRMAGDVLFRASLEDCGDAGRKLLMSVKAWQLARALGFRDARMIVRPAVQYLLRGERSRKLYESARATLGKEGADLQALAAGGRPLDEEGRMRLATLLAAASEEGCVTALLGLLREGYAAAPLAQGIAVEAAKRLLPAEGYHIELLRGLLFTRAAHFVLEFSRTDDRLFALFEAALRVRSPAPHLPSVPAAHARDGDEARERIAEDLRSRRPREAAAHVRAYAADGHPVPPLLALLGRAAALDSSLANGGHNLLLAEACFSEYVATKAPEFPMALAKSVAASPKDLAASNAWAKSLG